MDSFVRASARQETGEEKSDLLSVIREEPLLDDGEEQSGQVLDMATEIGSDELAGDASLFNRIFDETINDAGSQPVETVDESEPVADEDGTDVVEYGSVSIDPISSGERHPAGGILPVAEIVERKTLTTGKDPSQVRQLEPVDLALPATEIVSATRERAAAPDLSELSADSTLTVATETVREPAGVNAAQAVEVPAAHVATKPVEIVEPSIARGRMIDSFVPDSILVAERLAVAYKPGDPAPVLDRLSAADTTPVESLSGRRIVAETLPIVNSDPAESDRQGELSLVEKAAVVSPGWKPEDVELHLADSPERSGAVVVDRDSQPIAPFHAEPHSIVAAASLISTAITTEISRAGKDIDQAVDARDVTKPDNSVQPVARVEPERESPTASDILAHLEASEAPANGLTVDRVKPIDVQPVSLADRLSAALVSELESATPINKPDVTIRRAGKPEQTIPDLVASTLALGAGASLISQTRDLKPLDQGDEHHVERQPVGLDLATVLTSEQPSISEILPGSTSAVVKALEASGELAVVRSVNQIESVDNERTVAANLISDAIEAPSSSVVQDGNNNNLVEVDRSPGYFAPQMAAVELIPSIAPVSARPMAQFLRDSTAAGGVDSVSLRSIGALEVRPLSRSKAPGATTINTGRRDIQTWPSSLIGRDGGKVLEPARNIARNALSTRSAGLVSREAEAAPRAESLLLSFSKPSKQVPIETRGVPPVDARYSSRPDRLSVRLPEAKPVGTKGMDRGVKSSIRTAVADSLAVAPVGVKISLLQTSCRQLDLSTKQLQPGIDKGIKVVRPSRDAQVSKIPAVNFAGGIQAGLEVPGLKTQVRAVQSGTGESAREIRTLINIAKQIEFKPVGAQESGSLRPVISTDFTATKTGKPDATLDGNQPTRTTRSFIEDARLSLPADISSRIILAYKKSKKKLPRGFKFDGDLLALQYGDDVLYFPSLRAALQFIEALGLPVDLEDQQFDTDQEEGTEEEAQTRVRYLVKEGDTLASIASDQLGDSRYLDLIVTINRSEILFRNLNGCKIPFVYESQVLWLPSESECKIFERHFFASAPQAPTERYVSIEPPPVEQDLDRKNDGENRLPESNSRGIDSGPPPVEHETLLEAIEDFVDGSVLERRCSKSAASREPEVLTTECSTCTNQSHGGRSTYVVKAGDTLQSIAFREPTLGDDRLWVLIARVNNLTRDTDRFGAPLARLREGQVIAIPNASDMRLHSFLETMPSPDIICASIPDGTTVRNITESGAIKQESSMGASDTESSDSKTVIRARRVVEVRQYSDNCRMTVTEIEGQTLDFTVVLESLVNGQWRPVSVYEGRPGCTVRTMYRNNGDQAKISMNLPSGIVCDMAIRDFDKNWSLYVRSYTSEDGFPQDQSSQEPVGTVYVRPISSARSDSYSES